jgi:hypothetical protein
LPVMSLNEGNDKQDISRIDKAFMDTMRIVLGKELGPIDKFEAWLGKHTATVEKRKTAFGRETYVPFSSFPFMLSIDGNRFATNEEALELGKLKISLGEEEANVDSIRSKMEEIAYYSPEIKVGNNQNIIGCPLSENSMNVYKVVDANVVKNAGVSGQVFSSENVFGSFWVIDSKFCINCYHSANVANCFEMDSCSNCRNSLFCHNCEDLDNCMFCFNVKSKRYAIGNVEIGREGYMEVKEKVLAEIIRQLEKKFSCDYDIYNVGCIARKKEG